MSPVAALVVPSAPHLLPEYAGQDDLGAPLRARAVTALTELIAAARPDRIVVVTGHERRPRHTRGAVGARVARVMLAEAGWSPDVIEVGVPFDASAGEVAAAVAEVRQVPGRALLLVAADGTAKRSEKAPGHLDDRSVAVDEQIVGALARGDGAALSRLDPVLCEELWCTGRTALAVLAGCFPKGVTEADVLWTDAPYGVQYVLARWAC